MVAADTRHRMITPQLMIWTVVCLAAALGPILAGLSNELLRPLVWLAVVLGYRWYEQRVFCPREVHGARKAEWLFYAIWLSLAGSIVLPPIEFALHPRPFSVVWMVIGIVVAITGTWLRYLSVKTIGEHFSTHVEVRPGHELIDSGIMSIIRHPGYMGVMMFTVGAALILQSFYSLFFIFFVFWTTQLIRIYYEENELGENLKGYRDYMKRTKRLIPFVF